MDPARTVGCVEVVWSQGATNTGWPGLGPGGPVPSEGPVHAGCCPGSIPSPVVNFLVVFESLK